MNTDNNDYQRHLQSNRPNKIQHFKNSWFNIRHTNTLCFYGAELNPVDENNGWQTDKIRLAEIGLDRIRTKVRAKLNFRIDLTTWNKYGWGLRIVGNYS